MGGLAAHGEAIGAPYVRHAAVNIHGLIEHLLINSRWGLEPVLEVLRYRDEHDLRRLRVHPVVDGDHSARIHVLCQRGLVVIAQGLEEKGDRRVHLTERG